MTARCDDAKCLCQGPGAILWHRTVPDRPLYRQADARRVLEVSRARISELYRLGSLPAPARYSPAGRPLWDATGFDAWAAERKTRLGLTELDRFRENFHVAESGCWLWGGGLTYGYGRFTLNGRRTHAHRASYELHVGPIPVGLTLDHLCRVRNCVNPAHLEPVTNGENVLRGVSVPASNARKTHCKYGHEFTPENTRPVPLKSGGFGRYCRACAREREQRRRDALRLLAHSPFVSDPASDANPAAGRAPVPGSPRGRCPVGAAGTSHANTRKEGRK